MQNFIKSLTPVKTKDLNSMYCAAKGLEKDIIGNVLIQRIYSKK